MVSLAESIFGALTDEFVLRPIDATLNHGKGKGKAGFSYVLIIRRPCFIK
jgi:hypothetical protein